MTPDSFSSKNSDKQTTLHLSLSSHGIPEILVLTNLKRQRRQVEIQLIPSFKELISKSAQIQYISQDRIGYGAITNNTSDCSALWHPRFASLSCFIAIIGHTLCFCYLILWLRLTKQLHEETHTNSKSVCPEWMSLLLRFHWPNQDICLPEFNRQERSLTREWTRNWQIVTIAQHICWTSPT